MLSRIRSRLSSAADDSLRVGRPVRAFLAGAILFAAGAVATGALGASGDGTLDTTLVSRAGGAAGAVGDANSTLTPRSRPMAAMSPSTRTPTTSTPTPTTGCRTSSSATCGPTPPPSSAAPPARPGRSATPPPVRPLDLGRRPLRRLRFGRRQPRPRLRRRDQRRLRPRPAGQRPPHSSAAPPGSRGRPATASPASPRSRPTAAASPSTPTPTTSTRTPTTWSSTSSSATCRPTPPPWSAAPAGRPGRSATTTPSTPRSRPTGAMSLLTRTPEPRPRLRRRGRRRLRPRPGRQHHHPGQPGQRGDGGGRRWPPGSPSISADGRRVAFESAADNLVPDSNDAFTDIFVRDLATHDTTLVSRASGATGAVGDQNSNHPSISADGNQIAFDSFADDLDPDSTDSIVDVFVRDLQANTTTLASRATGPAGAVGDSDPPRLDLGRRPTGRLLLVRRQSRSRLRRQLFRRLRPRARRSVQPRPDAPAKPRPRWAPPAGTSSGARPAAT